MTVVFGVARTDGVDVLSIQEVFATKTLAEDWMWHNATTGFECFVLDDFHVLGSDSPNAGEARP